MRLVVILLFASVIVAGDHPTLTAEQKLEIREAQIRLMNLTPQFRAAERALNEIVAKHTPEGYEIQDSAKGLELVKKDPPPAPTEKK